MGSARLAKKKSRIRALANCSQKHGTSSPNAFQDLARRRPFPNLVVTQRCTIIHRRTRSRTTGTPARRLPTVSADARCMRVRLSGWARSGAEVGAEDGGSLWLRRFLRTRVASSPYARPARWCMHRLQRSAALHSNTLTSLAPPLLQIAAAQVSHTPTPRLA